ncbi:MAG: hypothetical protein K6U03_01610 [Firmicutes bacterium]|nr:hypothetical protein [Bacillota bacterium]
MLRSIPCSPKISVFLPPSKGWSSCSITDRGETVLINVKLLEAATGRYLAAERIEVKKAVKT